MSFAIGDKVRVERAQGETLPVRRGVITRITNSFVFVVSEDPGDCLPKGEWFPMNNRNIIIRPRRSSK